ncbi:Zn-ribbon domain-containing OB-fold protein [Streptomyces sp. NPDC090075]|uniref:Zn-ribbon domain-containing OB-fold protein n=1 Tax=Streptomyces sp. NPDC090075 TaxID=3365937 RepID=UPI00381DA6DA
MTDGGAHPGPTTATAGAEAEDPAPSRPVRPLPLLDDLNRSYWCGGADGRLRIHRCGTCAHYIHPPAPVCGRCYGRDVGAEPVSGRGVVHAFTVNHQAWLPDFPPPYVVALVDLEEQEGLRVFTNIVGCDVTSVHVGMPVAVEFVEQADVHVPVFRPLAGS